MNNSEQLTRPPLLSENEVVQNVLKRWRERVQEKQEERTTQILSRSRAEQLLAGKTTFTQEDIAALTELTASFLPDTPSYHIDANIIDQELSKAKLKLVDNTIYAYAQEIYGMTPENLQRVVQHILADAENVGSTENLTGKVYNFPEWAQPLTEALKGLHRGVQVLVIALLLTACNVRPLEAGAPDKTEQLPTSTPTPIIPRSTATTTPSPTERPVTQETIVVQETRGIVTAATSLNVRRSPNVSGEKVSTLPKDAVVVILGDNTTKEGDTPSWYRIATLDDPTNAIGWVSADYIDVQDPIPVTRSADNTGGGGDIAEPTPTVLPSATPRPTIEITPTITATQEIGVEVSSPLIESVLPVKELKWSEVVQGYEKAARQLIQGADLFNNRIELTSDNPTRLPEGLDIATALQNPPESLTSATEFELRGSRLYVTIGTDQFYFEEHPNIQVNTWYQVQQEVSVPGCVWGLSIGINPEREGYAYGSGFNANPTAGRAIMAGAWGGRLDDLGPIVELVENSPENIAKNEGEEWGFLTSDSIFDLAKTAYLEKKVLSEAQPGQDLTSKGLAAEYCEFVTAEVLPEMKVLHVSIGRALSDKSEFWENRNGGTLIGSKPRQYSSFDEEYGDLSAHIVSWGPSTLFLANTLSAIITQAAIAQGHTFSPQELFLEYDPDNGFVPLHSLIARSLVHGERNGVEGIWPQLSLSVTPPENE